VKNFRNVLVLRKSRGDLDNLTNRMFFYNRLKDFAKYLNLIRPRPFLFLQRKLNIHHDWKEAKGIAMKYKYQILLVTSVSSIPFIKPFLLNLQLSISLLLSSAIQEQEVNYLNENFVKKVVEGVLRSSQVRREAGYFVENLSKEEVLERAIVLILLRCLKDKDFEADFVLFAKKLIKELLHDPIIEKDIKTLFIKSFRDQELRLEVKDIFLWILQQEEMKVAMCEALAAAIKTERMKQAVFDILQVSFNDIMLDKNTGEKMRRFVFDLLDSEGGKEGSVKKAFDYFIERTFTWKKQHASRVKFDDDLFPKKNTDSDPTKEFQFF
jgi:hypothetical protein